MIQRMSFYFIADWHALTSDYADSSAIAENTLQIMIDYLAAGLDPQKSVIFSAVGDSGACGVAFVVVHGDAAGMVGAGADVQGGARERQGQGPAQLRVPGVSSAADGGHCDLQSTRGGGQEAAPLYVPVGEIRSRTWRFLAKL